MGIPRAVEDIQQQFKDMQQGIAEQQGQEKLLARLALATLLAEVDIDNSEQE